MIVIDGNDGSQLNLTDPKSIVAALLKGDSILRSNGTFAIVQVKAGDSSDPANWIVDGVPLLVAPTVTTPPTQPAAPGTVAPGAAPTIYRMALQSPDGSYATGANYPGCSPNNPGACDPQQLPDLISVVNYANSKHETPILISTPAEAWAIVNGTEIPTPAQAITGNTLSSIFQNPIAWLIGAWAAWKYLR